MGRHRWGVFGNCNTRPLLAGQDERQAAYTGSWHNHGEKTGEYIWWCLLAGADDSLH